MAKTKISEYDSTAANNTDIDSINIAEGMAPSNVNNAIRELMAHLKDGLGAGTPVFLDQTNNRLGVGTITPDGNLDITGSGNTDVYINTGNNSGDNSRIFFGDTADIDVGYLSYDHGTNSMTFGVNAAERLRIDSSGNLLVGGTTYSQNSSEKLSVFGRTGIEADGSVVLGLDRQTSDGEIMQFRKDNATVGSISSRSGLATNVILRTATGQGAGIGGANSGVLPCDENGLQDNEINLGASGTRWKDLYLSGGVVFGDASGANVTSETLSSYEEGSWTPSFVGSGSESGQAYQSQVGTYVKIGRMVHAKFHIQLTSEGTFTGTYLLVAGLPFTIASSPAPVHANNCYFVSLGVSVYSVGLQLFENDTKMYLWAVKSAGVSRQYLANTDLSNATELSASIVYQTS